MGDRAVRAEIPPARTPARRRWIVRMLTIALLPAAAVACGVMSIRSIDLAPVYGEPWSGLSPAFAFALVACAVAGVACVFERRTRVTGVFVIAVVAIVNPMTSTVVLAFLGVL